MARNPGEQMGWFQNFRDLPLDAARRATSRR